MSQAVIAMFRDRPPPTDAQIHDAIGATSRTGRAVVASVRQVLGHPPVHRTPRRAADAQAAAAFEAWILGQVGPLPETSLDPALRLPGGREQATGGRAGAAPETQAAMLPAPSLRHRARVGALTAPAIRWMMGLALYIRAARGDGSVIDACVHAAEALDRLLAGGDPRDARWRTQRIGHFLDDVNRSTYSRQALWGQWLADVAIVDRYLTRYPEIAARCAPLRFALPEHRARPGVRRLRAATRAAAEARRLATCQAVADDLPGIHAALENRTREIAAIRASFDAQCAKIRAGELALQRGRLRFACTLPRTAIDGRLDAGTRDLDFAVVSRAYLYRRLDRGKAARWMAEAPGADHDLYLVYLGPRQPGDGLPILDLYAAGGFSLARYRTADQARALASAIGDRRWPKVLRHLRLFRAQDGLARTLANRCLAHKIILIPVHELHHAMTVARAAARSCLRGARIGEVMQQCHGPGQLTRIAVQPEPLYAYRAIAKMRTEPEDFWLSGADVDALIAVLGVMKANGWPLQTLAPAATLDRKCRPARYLYQRGGYACDRSEINMAIALALWPRDVRSHDLKHGLGRHLLQKGVDIPTIGLILHHREGESSLVAGDGRSATRIYCQATPQMQAGLARLFDAVAHDETGPS
uniref:hypothetical protein n=1 Tax=Edaphosphingomonas laterariae TaxID=861865 RepID=UPI001C529C73|nr:hypothetical protein [Sphingomonas laterariae]